LTITAHGVPVTQGSKTRGRNGSSYEAAKGHKEWRKTVTDAAVDASRYWDRMEGPVKARLWFYFERPKSHYRSGRNAHLLKDTAAPFPRPDVDKLVRAVFDSFTVAGVWADDSLVTDVRATKLWTTREDFVGVVAQIEALT
jgi:crossover junction endodeoxyribonuclease RusA